MNDNVNTSLGGIIIINNCIECICIIEDNSSINSVCKYHILEFLVWKKLTRITPGLSQARELDDEALFGDIGGLFGDPQNCHGDMTHPFVYEWPLPQDGDDTNFLHQPAVWEKRY